MDELCTICLKYVEQLGLSASDWDILVLSIIGRSSYI